MNIKKLILWLTIGLLDLAIFIGLGILEIGYDDFYDERQSDYEYGSLASRTTFQKVVYISYNIWVAINALFVLWLIIRLIKHKRLRKETPQYLD